MWLGEKEPDLSKVQVDRDIYQALSFGVPVHCTRSHGPRSESPWLTLCSSSRSSSAYDFLPIICEAITTSNSGLADPPDLNKTRAMVQLTLFFGASDRQLGPMPGVHP